MFRALSRILDLGREALSRGGLGAFSSRKIWDFRYFMIVSDAT